MQDWKMQDRKIGTLRIDENLKRHRVVSLRQHGFLVFKSNTFLR